MEENPILKEQVEWYKRQKELDEKEKSLLNERIAFEQEKTALANEKTKIAEDKALAATEAYNAEKKLTSTCQEVVKQQEKEIKKAKLLGAGGLLVGIAIAVLSLFTLL